jgi:hypothetical protein
VEVDILGGRRGQVAMYGDEMGGGGSAIRWKMRTQAPGLKSKLESKPVW